MRFCIRRGPACTAVMIIHKHSILANKAPAFKLFFGLAKGFGALTDVLATIAMCIFLSSARTGMQRTDSIIKTLTHFVINRGLLVTLIQVLLLVFFFAVEDRLYWFAFHVNVTKLYVNTFFAMLNGRSHLNSKKGERSLHSSYNYPNKVIHLEEASYHLSPTKYQSDGLASPLTPGSALSNKPLYRSPTPLMPTITKTVTVSER
ncbi:hypothetical protein Clacol_000874 [Clathrus columnatus]|uniref:DUF6534 domain-containing protein n=1 Tax=Clathrus columnatus TaxID=1419009 RepID=A0AAV5A072_9AGAM|nr:hypothetical protein Clacol_000874 [Clathrus columnatus]